MRLIWVPGLLIVILLITSCSSIQNSGSSPEIQDAMTQITLEPGNAAIVGKVMSTASGDPVPLPETVVRLAIVFWNEDHSDGAFVLEGGRSPSDITDENGVFVHQNIAPGDYVLIVGNVIGIHEILSEPDGSATIFTAEEDQIKDIGIIKVDLGN